MATTADFKNGLCLDYNNGLWQIVDFQHVKPGKGPAFVRTKLKNLRDGRVLENTFTAGVRVDTARVERRPHQFLYKDDMGYTFMHSETFEQIIIQENQINAPQFLKDGSNVEITVHAETETPLICELPAYIEAVVTYTEPAVKGNTSTNATKEATIDTGATVKVPLFIEMNERIKVDTRTSEYGGRVSDK